jgi:hypothetical protein
MIKSANLESFFILMNTRDDKLMHNSYLNKTLEKTDFLFPNIPKAFIVKPTELEQSQMINLLDVPITMTFQPTKTTNTYFSKTQTSNNKSDRLDTLESNKKSTNGEYKRVLFIYFKIIKFRKFLLILIKLIIKQKLKGIRQKVSSKCFD